MRENNIKAILFDLDGTLLDIDMDVFLEKYFEKMVSMARTRGLEQAETLEKQIWRATGVMVMDKNMHRTNREVFEEDFFRDYHYPQKVMEPFFDDFYTHGFGQLQDCCQIYPRVRSIMNEVFNKGFRVVIATNPLFPLSALKHRLNWAGVGDFSYELITSYEIMHFTKPHVEYYQEIAEIIGLQPCDCLMVGNDVAEDLSAAKAGMKTFLLKERLINSHNLPVHTDWEGYLDDLAHLMRELPAPVAS